MVGSYFAPCPDLAVTTWVALVTKRDPVTQTPRTGSCPICGKPAGAEFSPFCSRRCADIDLNRWLSGAYVVAGRDDEDEDGAPREDQAAKGDDGA
jgi:endogenous inhibitor of DNA gyrase (YacG/DUF329 family)